MLECSASEQTPQDYIVKIIYWEGCNHIIIIIIIIQAWQFISLTVFYMHALENAWGALYTVNHNF